MNLADIRRKALRQRQNPGEPSTPPQERPLADTPGPRVATPDPSPAAPATPCPFDPLGLIHSGREAVSAVPSAETAATLEDEDTAGFLGFSLAGESFAVEIQRVREVLRPRKVTAVPRTPHFIRGIISHRGSIVTIMDLAQRIGLSGQYRHGTERIVVVRTADGYCGLIVDRVERVIRLSATAMEPPPPTQSGDGQEFVMGISRYRGGLLAHLDMDKVLAFDRCAT